MNLNRRRRFLFLLLLAALNSGVLSDLAADRDALLRLRAALRGRTLLWNTTTSSPCFWKGVQCNETTNRVISLRLPGSGLSGELPPQTIGSLTALRVLSLRQNSLSGQLPPDLASCTLLTDIYLQGNRFAGEVPDSFFTLNNLLRLDLAGNGFTGTIPSGFNSLTQLRTLYMENNQFTGSLTDLHSLVRLRNFNVSFNALTGSIPSRLTIFSSQSFMGTSLCGGPMLPCSGNDRDNLSGGEIAGIAVGSGVFFLLILTAIYFSVRKCRSKEVSPIISHSPVKPPEEETGNPVENNFTHNQKSRTRPSNEIVFFGEDVKEFSLEELMGCSAEVMGKGTVGSTYKAYLDNGDQVIVKRLRNVSVSEEQFRKRMTEIGSMVHENLDPLKGYFYGTVEKLLLYEPKHNGSLSAHLQGKHKPLSWKTRAKIAAGVAQGLRYLHSISPKAVHGNIKSSNIYLTEHYNPIVSEYGLIALVAFFDDVNGYRAPEMLESGKFSQEADVYSFGIVLLELITGKSPEKALKEQGSELVRWVRSVARDQKENEIFDRSVSDVRENMVPILQLAISCTAQEPYRRPSIAEIMRRLDEIKIL